MKTFTIENETNNITLHPTIQEAEAVANAECFRNEAELAKLAADWPAARLVDIWNSLPAVTSVKKFKDRATAVTRIWKAIQNLGQPASAPPTEPQTVPETAPISDDIRDASDTVQPEAVIPDSLVSAPVMPLTPQTPDVAPDQASPKNRASRAKKAPTAAPSAGVPREGSKTSQVIEMLKREGGTTLEEIMTAMGWQKHTTRAMLSAGGSLTKKHGLVIISEKVGEKRTYSIKG